MADACRFCDAIPWENIKTWRQVDEDDDPRPPVDFNRLNVKDCFVCRAIWEIRDVRSTNRLTYHEAELPERTFSGYLTLGFDEENQELAPLSLGVLDVRSTTLRPKRMDFVAYEALVEGMSRCWQHWKNDHAGCGPEAVSNFHNLQVLDCNEHVLVPASVGCEYLALSYVWGDSTDDKDHIGLPSPDPSLTGTNDLDTSTSCSTPSQLMPSKVPRVVHDAMVVTRKLGFRYLWIDRYCINQQDAGIKHQQIQQMWDIYASASITLIATAGDGPNHGLPGVSLPRPPDRETRGTVTLVRNIAPTVEICTSAWARRAWTFQENFVSRRKIFFTDQCASYACEKYMMDDIPANARFHHPTWDIDTERDHKILKVSLGADASSLKSTEEKQAGARQCIEAYCARSLTYDSDSLNAILGILVHFGQDKKSPVHHIWGVLVTRQYLSWGYHLHLHWIHPFTCRRRKGFPTWSPLAWEGSLSHISCSKNSTVPPMDGDSRRNIYIIGQKGDESLRSYINNQKANGLRDLRTQDGAFQRSNPIPDTPLLVKFVGARVFPVTFLGLSGNIQVVLQLQGIHNVHLPVFWDQEPQEDKPDAIGLVLHAHKHGDLSIMLLKAMQDSYERIGMVLWDHKDGTYVVQDRSSGVKKLVKAPQDNPAYHPNFLSESLQTIVIG